MLSHKAGDACDKPGAQAVSGSHSNRKLWLPPFFPSSSALPLLKPLFGVTANPNTGHPVFSGGLGALEDHVMGSGPSTHLFNAKFWVSLTLRTGDKEIQQQVQMSVLLTSLGHKRDAHMLRGQGRTVVWGKEGKHKWPETYTNPSRITGGEAELPG